MRQNSVQEETDKAVYKKRQKTVYKKRQTKQCTRRDRQSSVQEETDKTVYKKRQTNLSIPTLYLVATGTLCTQKHVHFCVALDMITNA